jgi:hypothetical protein
MRIVNPTISLPDYKSGRAGSAGNILNFQEAVLHNWLLKTHLPIGEQ